MTRQQKFSNTYWNKTLWHAAIIRLPRGLTAKAAAKRLGKKYHITYQWLKHFKYGAPDSRRLWRRDGRVDPLRRLDPSKVDWKMHDADIGRKFKVTRERVRQVRNREGKAKVKR